MVKVTTGEPTHTDDAGKERPGSQGLNTVVTPKTVADTEALWAEHYANNKQRNSNSAQNPNISVPYSPLETLIEDAYLRFGNMTIDTIDPGVKMVLHRYSNKIVERIRIHPYSTLPDLDYYTSLQDTRPIPDEIMISGLAYHYAAWMKSDRAKELYADYVEATNQILYQRKFGSGRLQMNTVDKDTTPLATTKGSTE